MINVSLIPRRLLAAGFSMGEATELYGQLTGMVMPLLYMPMLLVFPVATVLTPAIADAAASGRITAAAAPIFQSRRRQPRGRSADRRRHASASPSPFRASSTACRTSRRWCASSGWRRPLHSPAAFSPRCCTRLGRTNLAAGQLCPHHCGAAGAYLLLDGRPRAGHRRGAVGHQRGLRSYRGPERLGRLPLPAPPVTAGELRHPAAESAASSIRHGHHHARCQEHEIRFHPGHAVDGLHRPAIQPHLRPVRFRALARPAPPTPDPSCSRR